MSQAAVLLQVVLDCGCGGQRQLTPSMWRAQVRSTPPQARCIGSSCFEGALWTISCLSPHARRHGATRHPTRPGATPRSSARTARCAQSGMQGRLHSAVRCMLSRRDAQMFMLVLCAVTATVCVDRACCRSELCRPCRSWRQRSTGQTSSMQISTLQRSKSGGETCR